MLFDDEAGAVPFEVVLVAVEVEVEGTTVPPAAGVGVVVLQIKALGLEIQL